MTGPAVERVEITVCTVPTDGPEADGTLAWDDTTIVIVEAHGGGRTGLGYTYSHRAAATLIDEKLKDVVVGRAVMAVPGTWQAMVRAVRNLGRSGLAASAIAAVDVALWDLKARVLDVPLYQLLGSCRDEVMVYGSGGFTSYSDQQVRDQFRGWAEGGIRALKMKVGSEPAADLHRVQVAREAIGPEVALFIDANGALTRKQALAFADLSAREFGVSWFEEPVSSDDLEGLRLIRDRAPPGMDITAGEYAYTSYDFRRLIESGAIDVVQPDVTRCLGVTGFMQAAALCRAHNLPLSAHTAPSIHGHLCCAAENARHVEYFHDHVRVEHLLFDGALDGASGVLRPDPDRPGLGLELKRPDAARFAA